MSDPTTGASLAQSRPLRSRTKTRRVVLALGLVPLLVMSGISAAWAFERHLFKDAVPRGTQIAGIELGGTKLDEAGPKIASAAESVNDLPITIKADDVTLETTAREIGYTVDVQATVRQNSTDSDWSYSPANALKWPSDLGQRTEVPWVMKVDETKLNTKVEDLELPYKILPKEPTIALEDGVVTFVPGSSGLDIDPALVRAELPAELSPGTSTIKVTVERSEATPGVADERYIAVRDQTEALLSKTFTVEGGSEPVKWDRDILKDLVAIDTTNPADPKLITNDEAITKRIARDVSSGSNPTGVTFTMADGVLVPTGGKDATVCCGDDATALTAQALLAGSDAVALSSRTMTAEEGRQWAAGLGVKEEIGSFTTNHPAGQPRVQNIHRMADQVRGQLIAPGGRISLNDLIGPRTLEKGYVNAPVIIDGEFEEDVGGGVSQFATTMFNTAFYSGMNIPKHQSHSVYISRYPFGLDATLAYPIIDLVVENPSPYGVVVWTSYSESSITVTFYSTKWASGSVAKGPTAAKKTANAPDGCGTVRTTRRIDYVAGGNATDSFTAWYTCDPPEH